MSAASRRNQKNLWARPDVVGRDVWEASVAVAQTVAASVAMADLAGQTTYRAGCDARLEGLMIQASGIVGLGRIGVDVRLNGLVVGSGALFAGGPPSVYVKLLKAEQQDVAVASGDLLTINAQVDLELDAGQTLRGALSLALLQRPER